MRNLPYGWPALATVAAFACSSGAPAPRANAGSGSSGSAGGSGSSATSGSIGSGSSTSGILNGASGSGSAGGGVISSGSASSGVMSSGASGGASSGSASSSGATTTGGETDDASGDSAVESSEGGGDCATAGYQLCDDFEGVAAGAAGSVWTIDNKGYTVETVTTQAHSGTHSVHVQSTGSSGLGYIVESMTFPATDFWGRAYLMFMAPGSGHEVFAAMDSTPSDDSGEQVRILNDLGGGQIATNRRSDDQSKQSSQKYPMGTWSCYEWHETPTELHVYFNGQELMDVDETWTEPTLVDLRLGFERFDTGTGGDIWIDDVAVNSSQIGCN
jgi:hypothetical protein